MKKTLLVSALALISFNALSDTSIPDVKGQLKVTANVAAGCDMSAENINFGSLISPVTAQQASGNINLTCSKGASLSLGIAYGNSGSTSSSSSSSVKYRGVFNNNHSSFKTYNIYENSRFVGEIHCNIDSRAFIYGDELLSYYGIEAAGYNPELCNEMTLRTDNLSYVNMINSGKLIGSKNGEKIGYFLEIPETTNVWNTSNLYKITATGNEQLIPMKATIDVANSPTHRMTPDVYLDTLTVQLTY